MMVRHASPSGPTIAGPPKWSWLPRVRYLLEILSAALIGGLFVGNFLTHLLRQAMVAHYGSYEWFDDFIGTIQVNLWFVVGGLGAVAVIQFRNDYYEKSESDEPARKD